MDQFQKMLARLSLRQRVTIVVVALTAAVALYSVTRWRKEADFKPLYTGLAAEDSGAVVQRLKESGAEFRLSDAGDVISVPSARLAELRLDMAAAGLPKTGRIGFEIFDKNNLGTTEFVEQVNFRRALEGELERSINALAEVEQSRVHVTFPKDSVFVESREPAKASAMVKLRAGAHLAPRNVTAITHLVASAVEGLLPDAVSVLDMQGNLLSQPIASPDEAASEAGLDYRQKVEHDLVQKINTTLDPLLGKDRYRAGVSVECDLTSGEQSEESFDPTRSVMVSSQKSEDVTTGNSAAGVPGTASNLPRPTSRPGTAGNSASHRTENITYESSRTVRKVKLPQGTIKRISIAVLLDQDVRWEGAGKNARRVLIPATTQTIQSVHDVVAAVSGAIPDRGDQIIVENLPFESTLNQMPPEPPQPPAPVPQKPAAWNDWKHLPVPLPVAGGAGALLILGAGILFSRSRRKGGDAAPPEMPKSLPGNTPTEALEPANLEEQIQAQLAERAELQKQADRAALASIKVPPVRTKKAEVLAKELRENAKNDPSSSAIILQTWIHDRG